MFMTQGTEFHSSGTMPVNPLPNVEPLPLSRPQLSTHSHPVDYTADYEPSCCRQPIVFALWFKTPLPWCWCFQTFIISCWVGLEKSDTMWLFLISWCWRSGRRVRGLRLPLAWGSQVLDKNAYDTRVRVLGNTKNNMMSQITENTAGLSVW